MEVTEDGFGAFVGIDWAEAFHAFSVKGVEEAEAQLGEIPHEPEALEIWVNELRKRFPKGKIGVCLEQAKGPLMFHLMEYDCFVLYPVNPKSLKCFRESFVSSGAKDDPGDADYMRRMIEQHRDCMRAWEPDDPQTRMIAILTEDRRKMVSERAGLANRLTAALKAYFPQALEWMGDRIYGPLACDFVSTWERLDEIKRARKKTIRKFYQKHRCRDEELLQRRIEEIRAAVPLTMDEAIISTSVLKVRSIVRQLRVVNQAIREYDEQLEALFAEHPDADIFDSFPGAGEALAPRLLAAWGSDRDRHPDARSMQMYSGIAPVTKKSGKKGQQTPTIHRRYRCPKFLLQTFHEYARCSLQKSVWAKAYYTMMRDRGKRHHAALRALAFKWIRIMFRCWQDRCPYDEIKYLTALQRTHAPLLQYIAQAQA